MTHFIVPSQPYDPFQKAHGTVQALPWTHYSFSPAGVNARVATSPGVTLTDLTASYGGHSPGTYVLSATEQEPRQLAGAVAADSTSLTLTTAANLPAQGYLFLGSEVVRYSGRDGDTLTGLRRGMLGTSKAAHGLQREVKAAGWWLCAGMFLMYCGPTEPRPELAEFDPPPLPPPPPLSPVDGGYPPGAVI